MRNALIKQLTTMALQDQRIHVILPDIGVFAFKQAGFPEKQTKNCGICEAAAVQIASGLALTKKIPVVYTIASFATARCLEQIKMACYNNLPIKIVGVGAGLTYSHEGPTHHACDDISLMRSIPDMYVYSPCSSEETTLITQEIVNNCKPSYIRLTTQQYNADYDFRIKEYMPFMCQRPSIYAKVAIITTGGIMNNVLEATENDNRFSVYSMSRLWPIKFSEKGPDMIAILRSHKIIVTIEEHCEYGGLGTIIGEIMHVMDIKSKLRTIGIESRFCPVIGSREEVLDWTDLSIAQIKRRLNCIAK